MALVFYFCDYFDNPNGVEFQLFVGTDIDIDVLDYENYFAVGKYHIN
jgi:hypothetical protein